MRKKFLAILFLSIIVFAGNLFSFASDTSAHSACSGLSTLTDPLAIRMEKGERLIWDNVNPDLVAAKNKYVNAINNKGWKITFSSAYRPEQYQKHLKEIFTLYNKKSPSSCIVAAQKEHGIQGQVATTSNHTKGLAFDATIKDKNGKVLNANGKISSELLAVANSVGLTIPVGVRSNDAVHHELLKAPTTTTTTQQVVTTGYPKQAKISNVTTSLNVRSAANTTSSVIGSLKNNASVTLTGISGNFYRITLNGKNGWISKSYVTITSTTTTTVSKYPKTGYVNTTSTSLNVRKTASATSTILGTVKKGKALTVTGKSGNFYSIKVNNTTIGYVAAEYVTFTKPKEETKAVVSEYPKTGYVNTTSTSLNVRKTASATSTILGTVKKGKVLTVTGKSGNFYSIKVNSTTIGYVAAEYVTFTKPKEETKAVVSEYPKTGYVNTTSTSLNVRKTASATSTILGTVKKGKALTVTGKSGNFYSIKVNSTTIGYVAAEYVTFTKPAETPASEYPKTGYINTLTTGLNFRTAADGNSSVIALLTKGTAVSITGKTGNWYQAVVGGKTGYLSADYISFTKPTSVTTTNTNISAALPASKGKKATDSTFTAFLPTLANIEGGFSNHPLDSGGKTNYGITEATYKVYYPGKSIYNITYAEAVNIYKIGYWNPISPSILSERLAIVLFDSFVNHGSGTATKMLQNHLGLKADGIYGSGTKNKVMSLTVQQQDELALKYLQLRKTYRSNIPAFQNGWAARDLKIYNYIKSL